MYVPILRRMLRRSVTWSMWWMACAVGGVVVFVGSNNSIFSQIAAEAVDLQVSEYAPRNGDVSRLHAYSVSRNAGDRHGRKSASFSRR